MTLAVSSWSDVQYEIVIPLRSKTLDRSFTTYNSSRSAGFMFESLVTEVSSFKLDLHEPELPLFTCIAHLTPLLAQNSLLASGS